MRRSAIAAVSLALAGSACFFDPNVPGDAVISCSAESPTCPAPGQVCSIPLRRCVSLGAFDDSPPEVVPRFGTLTLIPPPGSPLFAVTRLGLLGRARILVDTNEPLAVTPKLDGQTAISCGVQIIASTSFVFDCQLPPDSPRYTGPFEITAELTDFGGNVARRRLEGLGLVVDTEPPAPPPVDTEGAVLLVRMPWGSLDGGEAPRQQVLATQLEPETTLIARAGLAEQGRTTVGADGKGALELGGLDLDRVDLEVFDQAGNASPRASVRDVEWVATLGRKVAGDVRLNPNRLDARLVHGDALAREDALELGAADGLVALDGTGPELAGGWTWEAHRSLEFPEAAGSVFTVSAFDARRARLVRFPPAELGSVVSSTLAEWNGLAWQEVIPSDPELDGNPSARRSSSLSYDALRQRSVLFGGALGSGLVVIGLRNDTWTWNGRSWRKANPAHSPSPRRSHATVWNPARGAVVLFGGVLADGGSSDETWEWSGLDWSPFDGGAPPPARSEQSMAWDPIGQRVLVFGGAGKGGCQADLWALGPSGWVELDAGAGPSPRCNAGFAEGADGRPVLAGGAWTPGTSFGASGPTDVWRLDGEAWALASGDAGVFLQGTSSLVYDSSRGELLLSPRRLHQGGGLIRPIDPLRTWNGADFVDRASRLQPYAAQPRERAYHQMAWSPLWNGLVLFGGHYGDGGTPLDETWLWKDAAWTALLDGGVDAGFSPASRSFSGMATAPTGDVVLRGGSPGETESWAFSLQGWRRDSPDGGLTALDGGPSSATFLTLVPFQGGLMSVPENSTYQSSSNSYTFDTQLRSAAGVWSPGATFPGFFQPISGAQLADGRAVVVGSTFATSDNTMVFDSAGVSASNQPVPPLGPAVAFEPRSGLTVLFGGATTQQVGFADTYFFTDAGWEPLPLADPENDGAPTARAAMACAADPQRGRVVIHGGNSSWYSNSAQTFNELWELGTWGTRPSFVFEVDLLSARIPPQAVARSVQVRVGAGGNGGAGSSAAPGVDVKLWKAGQWAYWASNVAPTAAPATLEVVEQDPAALRTLTLGWPSLAVAVLPRGTSAVTPATVKLDAIELRVRYRLP